MANKNLTNAKNAKNDEFYTCIEDIQKELYNYPNAFIDKIVYLNCDDGEWSNFWRYFYQRFHSLKLKKLIATSYKKEGGTYKYEFEGDGSDYKTYIEGVTKTLLKGDGDFRSDECIEILKQADVVVTNPPFSLYREYVAQLIKYEKKFIILSNMNSITYKEIFPLIKDNKMWAGFSFNKTFEFIMPDSYELKGKAYVDELGRKHGFVPAIAWFTNINHSKRHHPEEYYAQYSEEEYPRYDNYDAINVDKVKDIPCDWTGYIGVPITFLDKYCPEQFEIVDGRDITTVEKLKKKSTYLLKDADSAINGKPTYGRIVIRWKPEAMPKIINGVVVYNKENING